MQNKEKYTYSLISLNEILFFKVSFLSLLVLNQVGDM